MYFADIINTVGVSLILLAFFLLTLRKIKQGSYSYMIMNLCGAGMACYGSWLIEAIPFMVLEGIWALVSLMGLVRNIIIKRQGNRNTPFFEG